MRNVTRVRETATSARTQDAFHRSHARLAQRSVLELNDHLLRDIGLSRQEIRFRLAGKKIKASQKRTALKVTRVAVTLAFAFLATMLLVAAIVSGS